jgi:hypothetical protein
MDSARWCQWPRTCASKARLVRAARSSKPATQWQGRSERAPFRNGDYAISVRHPRVRLGIHASEQHRVGLDDVQGGPPVLARGGLLNFATEVLAHELHAVTDAEDRARHVPDGRVDSERLRVIHGLWATGHDDGARICTRGASCRRKHVSHEIGIAPFARAANPLVAREARRAHRRAPRRGCPQRR